MKVMIAERVINLPNFQCKKIKPKEFSEECYLWK